MTTKTNTISKVLEALGVLEKSDPNLVAALKADMDLTAKASIGAERSEDLGGAAYVKDHWSRGETNRAATKEEIKTGPAEESSGGGAEKMVGDYSHPARQMHGVASTPEKLADHLAHLSASQKALADGINALAQSSKSTNALLVALLKGDTLSKAADHEDEAEEDEEESEVVEINAGKAKSLLAEAAKLVKAIRKCGDEAAKAVLKSDLTKILAKAEIATIVAGDKEARKSVYATAAKAGISKADINVVQEEEEDEEEEETKSKSAKAEAPADTTKAVTDDKGNIADTVKVDGGSANQADHAKSKTMEDLTKGQAMIEMKLSQMFDVIAGKSKLTDLTPDIAKANITADKFDALAEKIERDSNSGTLLPADALAAKQILDMSRAEKAGQLDGAIVKARLSKSSTVVRNLFAPLAA